MPRPTTPPPTPTSGNLAPLVVAAAVVVLVAVIAVVALVSRPHGQNHGAAGATVSDDVHDERSTTADAVSSTGASTTQASGTSVATDATRPVAPARLTPRSASASCVAPEGYEADRTTVRYDAGNVLDGRSDTAWRCPGSAIGATVRVNLPVRTELTQIGLLPGYAKVDPTDGTNRFFENRRITAVRYHFDDGSTADQRFEPIATIQTVPVSASTSSIVIEILSTTGDGGRDFTAISEVEVVGRPATDCERQGVQPELGC
jgi:hypothetical protein